jgi:hypothetical protein
VDLAAINLRQVTARTVIPPKITGGFMKRSYLWFLIVFLLSLASTAYASRTEYEIEVSHDDEFFIINGEKYEAKTYCYDMEEGDMVIFLDGSPYGACASAKILNLRTKEICELWCE